MQQAEENWINPTMQGFYNRRVGLLLSRTALPGNTLGIPARAGSNGQAQLTERFFNQPVFNQPCATIERRGNPTDDLDNYFTRACLGLCVPA